MPVVSGISQYQQPTGFSMIRKAARSGGQKSVSGTATVSQDRRAIRELYQPDWKAWFGDQGGARDGGPDDPRMALILVDVHTASYLVVNKPQPVVHFEVAKAMVTGTPPKLGEERHVSRAELS